MASEDYRLAADSLAQQVGEGADGARVADAIIAQRCIEVESRLLRVMAIARVRGSAPVHSDELREYCIDDAGTRIGAMLAEQEGLLGGRPTRKRAVDLPVSVVGAGDH